MGINLVETWAERAANSIEALKIMGMGMLSIFIVIGIITLVVYIMNTLDRKSAEKKLQVKVASDNVVSNDVKSVDSAKAVLQSSNNVESVQRGVTTIEKDEEPISRADIDSKYRKCNDDGIDSPYRKNNEDK